MRRVAGMVEALAVPQLGTEETNELARKAKTDPASREKLVAANLKLILHFAKRFRGTLKEDAFGESSVGFLEAVDSYDPGRGNFIAWSCFCMWVRLRNARMRGRTHWNDAKESLLVYAEESLLNGQPSQPGYDPMSLIEFHVSLGTITKRQGQILLDRAKGIPRRQTQQRLRIGKMTYDRDCRAIKEALGDH